MLGNFDAIHSNIDDLYSWAILHGEQVCSAALFIHYLDDPDEVPPEKQRAIVWLPLEEVA